MRLPSGARKKLTVSNAEELITEPATFEIATRTYVLLSSRLTAGIVYVAEVAPAIGFHAVPPAFKRCHW